MYAPLLVDGATRQRERGVEKLQSALPRETAVASAWRRNLYRGNVSRFIPAVLKSFALRIARVSRLRESTASFSYAQPILVTRSTALCTSCCILTLQKLHVVCTSCGILTSQADCYSHN